EELPVYKLRPAVDTLPDRWMTGTQNHEGMVGVAAAIDYLTEIGGRHTVHQVAFPSMTGRRLQLHAGMAAIQAYEAEVGKRLFTGRPQRRQFKVWGIADPQKVHARVPTISITSDRWTPEHIPRHLNSRQIFVWNGNMYALALTERLGLESR